MPDSEGFPSGQRDQTVNLTRKLRRFESCPLHHLIARGHRIVAITSAFQADDAGSIPAARSNFICNAHVAQSVEHILGKDEVTGSTPVMSSTIYPVSVTIQVDQGDWSNV
ncbi:hypothetical protein LCGC14_2179430 [marine sediment metagenome]|uniref:Uncharacterized protein n=1 Tax=marine sediment metagenome TaxID=412755 RepID=A0A0F9GIK9_9ZZZZ